MQRRGACARLLSGVAGAPVLLALGIAGLFCTTGTLAGSNERMLTVADALTERLRRSN